jgi:pimeloyl-ACP methyl ester carboxylesterase
MNGPSDYITGFVTSADGTKIGYRQMGKGAGLILVHGGVQSSQSFMELGRALSDDFTVYIPDRRGRGLSGGFGVHYSILSDCEDLRVLIRQTNAQNIFGLSSGAIITLQTAIIEPALKKIALYEPPIIVDGVDHSKMDRNFDAALARGNIGKAMISILKGTGDSSLFAVLPAFITAPLMNFGMKRQLKNLKTDSVPLKALYPLFIMTA